MKKSQKFTQKKQKKKKQRILGGLGSGFGWLCFGVDLVGVFYKGIWLFVCEFGFVCFLSRLIFRHCEAVALATTKQSIFFTFVDCHASLATCSQ